MNDEIKSLKKASRDLDMQIEELRNMWAVITFFCGFLIGALVMNLIFRVIGGAA